ncbi:hypothetical protein HYD27_13430 [Paenibacillus sp. S150]|nr:hypothetical protein [Paenibacillus sp. S150]
MKELVKSCPEQSSGADSHMTALMEQMDIKSMKLAYAVDKKTYLPTRTDVDMAVDMTAEGQSNSMDMKMKNTVNPYNEISDIQVPEEVLSAQEVQLPATQ